MLTYEDISTENFDSRLEKILDEASGSELLSIPGLYEVASEYYNNQILDDYAEENAHYRS